MMEDLISQIGTPAIAFVVPLILAGAKWLVPRIPKPLIPYLAVGLGVGFDQAIAYVDSLHATDPVMAAVWGALGVGLRELAVQLPALLKAVKATMKVSAIVLALVIAGAGVPLAGCGGMFSGVKAETAGDRVFYLQGQYATLTNKLADAVRGRIVTVDAAKRIRGEVLPPIRLALESAEDAALAGDEVGAGQWASIAESGLRALRLQLDASGVK